ncbi:MAG: transporter substrate-binding domain-containing protein [Lachnospiraceae bacterium]|nr:transporter substrate-binding domain-containing protein [Lachnospiraceae bacterium]MBR5738930.1 transporter substrate-binding domain-containing protein [Lachnospiraceae bacterium]
MKNWKKAIAVLTALAAALALFGCSDAKTTTAAPQDELARIKASGKLRIAQEGTWAPWTYHDSTDALVGYDADVAREIAKKLGVEPVFTEGEWDGLFAGFDGGRYDMIINGIEITETRRNTYDFSDAYAYAKTVIIVKQDSDAIKSFEDLNGKKTCNSIDSTYMNLAEQYGAEVMGVDSLEETINMVLAGRVDATLNSLDSFAYYMSLFPDAKLKIAATYSEVSEVAIPFKKGDDSKTYREAVNQALAELRADGTLKRLSEKYFGSDVTVQ